MLTLKNINKNKERITAQYVPEDSSEIGFLSIDLVSGELIDKKLTSYDEVVPNYLSHAKMALADLINKRELPKEKLVMWH